MQRIKIGTSQKIVFEQPQTPENKQIFLSIYGENGQPIKNSNGTEIIDSPLTYDSTAKSYSIEITIAEETTVQYIRLYYSSADFEISEENSPKDAYLYNNKIVRQEIVPVQYFINYMLNIDSNLDPLYRATLTQYIENNRTGIKNYLFAAQSELETDTGIYFEERTLTEKKDNNYEQFNIHFWQFETNYTPINSLVGMKLMFGSTQIADIGTELFNFDRITGLVEFMPVPSGNNAHLYNLLLNNLSAFGAGVINGGIYGRIPNMFEYTYKTGLFYEGADPNEKENIRTAVCRKAFVNILNFVDNGGKIGSISESLDGVSKSIDYQTGDLIRRLKEDEHNFIRIIQKRYGKTVGMVVV